MQYCGGLECTNEEKCLLSTIIINDKWYLFGTYLNSNGTFYLAIVAYYPHLLRRLTKLTEWIAYHDVLPAQSANAEVVTLGQVSARKIGGQYKIRPRGGDEIGLSNVPRATRRAFMDVIGGQGLWRAGEEV